MKTKYQSSIQPEVHIKHDHDDRFVQSWVTWSAAQVNMRSLFFLLALVAISLATSRVPTQVCDYQCESSGGCTATYVGRARPGKQKGSCFSDASGGSCSGTPNECHNCNQVLSCSPEEKKKSAFDTRHSGGMYFCFILKFITKLTNQFVQTKQPGTVTTNAAQMEPKATEAALWGTLDPTDLDKPLEAASLTHLEVDALEPLKNVGTAIGSCFADETHILLLIYLFIYWWTVILWRIINDSTGLLLLLLRMHGSV